MRHLRMVRFYHAGGGVLLAIAVEGCFSAPRCGRVRLDNGTTNRAAAKTYVAFPANMTELRLRARLRFTSGYGPRGLSLVFGPDDCWLDYWPINGEMAGFCGGTDQNVSKAPIPAAGNWMSFTLSVTRASGAAHVRVQSDEGIAALVFEGDLVDPQARVMETSLAVVLGEAGRDSSGTVDADDLVVNVH